MAWDMIEWDIVDSEERLEERKRAPGQGANRRRTILLLLGALGVVLLVAVVLVRLSLDRRAERLRADLIAFVEREERARAFGQLDQIELLQTTDEVNDQWAAAYRRSFRREGAAEPVELEIVEISLEGTGALVTVSLNGLETYRYYRLHDGGWRRAPLPGPLLGPIEQLEGADGISYTFRAPDRAFAERLAADLPALRERIAAWQLGLGWTRVEIIPVELVRRGARVDGERLLVASPSLYEQQSPWTTEESVRLEIAKELLDATPPGSVLQNFPNGYLHHLAARGAEGARWALDARSHALLREGWVEQAGDPWPSPFIVDPLIRPESDPYRPESARGAAARLFYDSLVRDFGARTLPRLFRPDPAASWGTRLEATTGVAVGELELAAAEAAGIRMAPAITTGLPLVVRVARVGSEPDRLLIQHEGLPGERWVEFDRGAIALPNGGFADEFCAPIFGELEIDGRWSADGRVLNAESLHVRELRPPFMPEPLPSPRSAFAFVLQREGGVDPHVEITAIRDDAPPLSLMVARDVSPMEFASSYRPERSAARDFVTLQYTVPGCDHVWIYMIHREQGTMGAWLLTPDMLGRTGQIFPRSGSGDMLLVTEQRRPRPYAPLVPGDHGPIVPAGTFRDIDAIGWLDDGERFVRFNWATNRIEIGPLEGEVAQVAQAPTRSAQLTADREALIYIDSTGLLADDWRVMRYEIATDELIELYRAPPGHRINDLALPGDPADTRLLILTDDASERGLLPVQLRLLDTSRPAEEPLLVIEQGPGRAISGYMLCRGDRVIYVENFSRLYSWKPGKRRSLIRSSSDRLAAWSCR